MMFMSSFSANNKGVLLLEDGHFKEALLQFKDAIEIMGTAIRAEKEFRNKHPQECSATDMRLFQWSNTCKPRRHNNSSTPYVLCRGIIVDEDDNYFSIVHMGAIIYNFALAGHLRALDLGARGSNLMTKSLKLYLRSSSLLARTPFCLAVLNNMLIIRHEMGSYEFATHLSGQLAKELDKYAENLDKNCFDFLLWNLLTLRQPTLSAAA